MAHPAAPTPDGSVRADPSGVLVVRLGDGVRAGFTTRAPSTPVAGGRPPAAAPSGVGANLGLGVGDDPEAVRARRRAVAAWAGGPVGWSTQVHGTGVVLVTGRAAGPDPVGEADAVVGVGGAGAAVVVADCVPVLLADPAAGVVAAVHAGRRGLADGVVQAAVAEMLRHGARAPGVRAVVGPAICGRCYEVPADLRDQVADLVPDVAARTSWGTPALDLPRGAAAVLRGLGVEVHGVGICTFTDDRFPSHRRAVRTGEPEARFAGVVRTAGTWAGVSQPAAAGGRH